MRKIFLSYAQDDHFYAETLSNAFLNVKVEGWTDQSNFSAGLEIGKSLRSAIRDSSAVVVLVSPHALQSRWVEFEIGAGVALGKPIIPILISGGNVESDLPEPFRELRMLDARNRIPAEIVQDVEKALASAAN